MMLQKNLQVKQEVIFGIQWCFEAGEVVDISQSMLQLAVIAAVKTTPLSCRRTPLVLLVPQGVDAWKHVKLRPFTWPRRETLGSWLVAERF